VLSLKYKKISIICNTYKLNIEKLLKQTNAMQQTHLRPVKMHNLLIGKNILVRRNIANPALYHQFQNPVITKQTTAVQHAGSI